MTKRNDSYTKAKENRMTIRKWQRRDGQVRRRPMDGVPE